MLIEDRFGIGRIAFDDRTFVKVVLAEVLRIYLFDLRNNHIGDYFVLAVVAGSFLHLGGHSLVSFMFSDCQ